jgi:hypothetical protein
MTNPSSWPVRQLDLIPLVIAELLIYRGVGHTKHSVRSVSDTQRPSAQVAQFATKMAKNRGRNFGHLSKNSRFFFTQLQAKASEMVGREDHGETVNEARDVRQSAPRR